MAKYVAQDLSLKDLYVNLCVRQHEINRLDAAGGTTCTACGCLKSAHLIDGRCSVSCLSREFFAVEADELAKVQRALVLIEELQGL